MADEDKSPEEEPEKGKSGGMMTYIILAVVALLAGGAGYMVPVLMATPPAEENEDEKEDEGKKDVSFAFIPVEAITVNLNEGRMTRYLRAKVTMQVQKDNEIDMLEMIEKKKSILRNWLIEYLMDKNMQEVTGRSSLNRMRREIKNHFNYVLARDGYERIEDILFEEFNVQ